jgi:hypothetical protein
LRGEGSRHRLSERQALSILILDEPPALLDEVALHVADCGNGTAKAE